MILVCEQPQEQQKSGEISQVGSREGGVYAESHALFPCLCKVERSFSIDLGGTWTTSFEKL